MITAMDPIEDESASADGDCEEEDNYNELSSLESCDSDSECEYKNKHKGRHEEDTIEQKYRMKMKSLYFQYFFKQMKQEIQKTISLSPCTKEQTRRYMQ
jgi:hypothetical protein